MALYLVVKSGESQGASYQVAAGLVVGRKGAQIRLDDPKVSTAHAKIEETADGLEIQDLASKNGILRKGERVDSVLLVPGAEFTIGQTLFQVVEFSEEDENLGLPSPPKAPKGKRWNQVLANFLRKALLSMENQPQKLEPMAPALILDFLRGAQTETRWILGYGPRQVGRDSVDLPIFEEEASPVSFEILPSSEGVQIKAIGKEVRLNGNTFSTEILKVGDRIQIYETELEVDFLE